MINLWVVRSGVLKFFHIVTTDATDMNEIKIKENSS
jgi:hypothetical protein